MVSDIFLDPDVIDDIFGLMSQCAADNPKLIMSQFDAKGENFGWDCAMLIIFFLVLRLIAYLALKVKVRPLLLYTLTVICSSRCTTTTCWRILVTSSNNSSTRASELHLAAISRDHPAAARHKILHRILQIPKNLSNDLLHVQIDSQLIFYFFDACRISLPSWTGQ